MSSALEKALVVLETVTAQLHSVNAIDVAEISDLPRQTVHRVLKQLESLELVQREPGTERYTVGTRFRRLSLAALSKFQQTQVTHDILATLARDVGETCNIGMLDGQEVIYLDRVECDWPLKVQLEPGSHVPTYCTAIGKLLLAFAEHDHQRHLLNNIDFVRHTEFTIMDQRTLMRTLGEIRDQGYAVNHGEDMIGLIALAVPIRDPSGAVVAGIAIHAPEPRMPLKTLLGWRGRLEEAARDVATSLFPELNAGGDGGAALTHRVVMAPRKG